MKKNKVIALLTIGLLLTSCGKDKGEDVELNKEVESIELIEEESKENEEKKELTKEDEKKIEEAKDIAPDKTEEDPTVEWKNTGNTWEVGDKFKLEMEDGKENQELVNSKEFKDSNIEYDVEQFIEVNYSYHNEDGNLDNIIPEKIIDEKGEEAKMIFVEEEYQANINTVDTAQRHMTVGIALKNKSNQVKLVFNSKDVDNSDLEKEMIVKLK